MFSEGLVKLNMALLGDNYCNQLSSGNYLSQNDRKQQYKNCKKIYKEKSEYLEYKQVKT